MDNTGVMGAEQVRGRAIGALFFLGFGTIWVYFGLAETGRTSPMSFVLLVAVVLVLLGGTLLLMRSAHELPSVEMPHEELWRARRMFTAVNIVQWVSIATAVAILNLLHIPEYISAAIAIIVGLHLFPLAESLRNQQHYVIGTLVIVWALLCLVAEPISRVSGFCALGTGAILLLSAGVTIGRYLLLLKTVRADRVVVQG